jgi:shikimate dehydrogenase
MILRDIGGCEDRPLISSEERLYEMARERRGLYLGASDATLVNDSGIDEAADDLLALIRAAHGIERAYAVIGDPIAHTLSPVIHGAVFEFLGISSPYDAVRVKRDELAGFAESARNSGLGGFNVTIPHKHDIIPFLDEVEEEARLCGAINTVLVSDGRLSGFNTDMEGLCSALGESGSGYRGRDVLILGTGGAARGVAFKASLEGAASVAILGRRPKGAAEIAENIAGLSRCRVHAGEMSDEAMSEAAREADILINATPLGMSGVESDFGSLEFLTALPRGAFVCDLVYNPSETALLRRAAALGHTTLNGLGMLIYQALLADELFLKRRLDKPALFKIIEERLKR